MVASRINEDENKIKWQQDLAAIYKDEWVGEWEYWNNCAVFIKS